MVDAVVSFAVERLGDYLIQEAVFLQGVRDEIKWLKRELEFMQSFLKDAEEKQASDNRVRQWVSTIKDISYDTEDVLDKFILEVEEGGTPEKGFMAFVKKYSCIVNKEAILYSIGKQIQELKNRVLDISRLRETYGIRNIGDPGEGTSGTAHGRLGQLRRVFSYAVEEEHVIGFEEDTAMLLNELFKDEPRRRVISILGMGGLGKTTLARKLYHCDHVREFYDIFAWVSVSQDYGIQDLLRRIIISFKQKPTKEELEMMEKMSKEDLAQHLRNFLGGRRYLVVLDDVWEKEVWESLRRALPEDHNGGAVIITTRNKAVAQRADERTHELRFRRPDESWELFCRKAFRNINIADEGLKMSGREMVGRCGGLPVALSILGRLLSGKKPHEWHAVREHFWRHLRNDSSHVWRILDLSFNNLPSQLKSCFLYLGLFPEGFEIPTEKLLRLWVAEGFIPQEDGTVLEEVAEDYLNELIDRNLIQVAKRSLGRVAACRVHDLLRDLVVEKAKELNFLHVYDGNVTSTPYSAAPSRRQAPHSGIEKYVSFDHWNPLLRSVLFFNLDHESLKMEQLKLMRTRFQLLRVLDLQDVPIVQERSLPDSIGKLIHLRYLGLRDTHIQTFPPSIVNLKNLQTLDVLGECIFMPPEKMRKLKHLRHLIGWIRGPLRLDNSRNLQTLKYVKFDDWIDMNPAKLINLRELRMDCSRIRKGMEFTLNSIAKLSSLRLLSLKSSHSNPFPPLQPLSHCQHLLELRLDGKIEKLPGEMPAFVPNLKCLELTRSELKQDPMPTLERLPSLMFLGFQYVGTDMICTAKGFPRLEILEIDGSDELEEWQVEEGAMPMLRGLSIKDCTKLRVPERLSYITITETWEFEDDWPSSDIPG